MGTRALTIVKKDGETKIAKYSQFDGYPSGLGDKLLDAIRELGVDKIREYVDNVREITQKEVDHVNTFNKDVKVKKDGYTTAEPEWMVKWPELSRETNGADLLYILAAHTGDPLPLLYKEKFAADSLFCEWCYVIDLDTNTFEVYEGFNKTPLTEEDRFFYLMNDNEDKISGDDCYPVKIVKSYSLDDLPEHVVVQNEEKEELV